LLDYAGMKFIYAVEMADRWQQLAAHPSRNQVVSTLNDLCCLDHFPAGDLMDGITELREDYRPAWLAEYAPYRLGTSLGKFDREFLYGYGFTRWGGQIARSIPAWGYPAPARVVSFTVLRKSGWQQANARPYPK